MKIISLIIAFVFIVNTTNAQDYKIDSLSIVQLDSSFNAKLSKAKKQEEGKEFVEKSLLMFLIMFIIFKK